DFEAVRRRLSECGIDMAARRALSSFAAVATAADLAATLRAECHALSQSGGADARGCSEAADRFGLLFATFPEWDFSPEWLNSLTTHWLDLLAAGARADWLDALAARVLGRCITLLSDPAQGASAAQLGT